MTTRAMSRFAGCRAAAPVLVLVLALSAALAAACGGDGGDGGSDSSGGGADVSLTVLAASSLTDVLEDAERSYEKDHPGVDLTFSFAGSQDLASQVSQGVPADVLVTADTETMDGVAGETGEPVVIARNEMVIVTPAENPGHVTSLADLADPGLRLVMAAPEVPAGTYGQEVLDRAGVDATPDSQEPSVRAVLSKVQLGEADAGLVYVTDAASVGDDVRTVAIPERYNVTATYPAATLDDSDHPARARDFVDWLADGEGQRLLREAGFQQP